MKRFMTVDAPFSLTTPLGIQHEARLDRIDLIMEAEGGTLGCQLVKQS